MRGFMRTPPLPIAARAAVICSAVLHFAEDEAHFGRMVTEMGRVLAPNGLFFALSRRMRPKQD